MWSLVYFTMLYQLPNGKNVEGNGPGLYQGTMPAFTWNPAVILHFIYAVIIMRWLTAIYVMASC
jgi:hypothetical protein